MHGALWGASHNRPAPANSRIVPVPARHSLAGRGTSWPMSKAPVKRWVQVSLSLALWLFTIAAVAGQPRRDSANVILLLGDGMDQQQLTIARNYLAGDSGMLAMDRLQNLSSVRVQTVAPTDPKRPVFVADSANTATTLATGVVTSTGRIAMDYRGLRKLPTLVAQAQSAGYRTGIVTTASVTDATVAAFATHSVHRKCEGPRDLRAALDWYGVSVDCTSQSIDRGGPGSIAHQLSSAGLDVLLGGGRSYFEQAGVGGEQRPLDTAAKRGYFIATDKAGLGQAPLDRPLLGLLAPTNMPTVWQGEGQRRAESVTRSQATARLAATAFACESNPRAATVPSLRDMTDKALGLLGREPRRGFFLLIESASIDKQAHARNPCGHIGEVGQLEQALKSALAFAAQNENTLVLVTADHGHAAQIIPDQASFRFDDHAYHSPGAVARVRTPGGTVMMINYATSVSVDELHTGTNVPLLAQGPGAGEIPAYLTQADIHRLIKDFLRLP